MLLLLCRVFLSFRAFWNTNPPHVVILSNRAWRGCRRISSGDVNLKRVRNFFSKEIGLIMNYELPVYFTSNVITTLAFTLIFAAWMMVAASAADSAIPAAFTAKLLAPLS